MWLLIAREPRPDAPLWPGRRWLAAVDAVAWPLASVLVFRQMTGPAGLVGPVAIATAALFAISRLNQALRFTHRYWFTTSRWGRAVAALALMGFMLKLALPS